MRKLLAVITIIALAVVGSLFYFKLRSKNIPIQKKIKASTPKQTAPASIPIKNEQPTSQAPGCGTVTDADGNTYTTIEIAGRCWMAQNMLATKYSSASAIANTGGDTIKARYCYPNSNGGDYCNTEGMLYSWWSAVGLPEGSQKMIAQPVQGICPTGWHISDDADWTALSRAYPASQLLGYGANSVGFGASYTGYYDGGSFLAHGTDSYYWSSDQNDSKSSFYWQFDSGFPNSELNDFSNNDAGYLVRCVKDF